ncbi:MAG: glycerate kinase [Spartobacteria bacterium]
MKILVVPDKFKGVLSAREVAENISLGLHDIFPTAKIDIVPMADGGEGTAQVICDALGGSWVSCEAHDPLGREMQARYVRIGEVAVIEMSEAAGMRRLQPGEEDVDLASTFGVGEMILDAARAGAKEIMVGLGGSATNDGGFGMARALGFRFFASDTPDAVDCLKQSTKGRGELELAGASSALGRLRRIEVPPGLVLPKIIAAADVRNRLLGEKGATRVFGPQKGITAGKIDIFEAALTKLADVVAEQFGFDYRHVPGAGAAGGLGFGLMTFCGANMRSGFEVMAEAIGLEAKMKDVDLVITGEGSLDRQTLEGKTPAGVARMARKLGKRVYAIVGRTDEDRQVHALFDGVFALTNAE